MKSNTTRDLLLLCVALAIITIAVYLQAGTHPFTYYDDPNYVTRNPLVGAGVALENLFGAFTSVHASNWHPVTWISHMIDVELYGMNPAGHHLTNVLVHTASSLLLLFLFFRLTKALWPSAFVAALFALHPLHVESVAWIAERKDVLSAFFMILTLLIYAEFTTTRTRVWYVLALVAFILGLMSKPMLVTLPAIMLLLDFWPLNRIGNGERSESLLALVKEKVPFFICSLFSIAITIYAQNKGGALRDLEQVPFGLRIENALVAYVTYIFKTFWPQNLAFHYPMPPSFPYWQSIGALLFLLIISGATILFRHKQPYLVVGWFWYLITLLPVIGLITVGSQAMADRYTYIPLIGIFAMVAWGVRGLAKDLPYRAGVLALLAGTVITIATCLTWRQIGYWRDDVSLFRHTLQATAGDYITHFDLAIALAKAGDTDAAIQEFQETVRLKPDYGEAYNSLGLTLARAGNIDAAIREFQNCLELKPNYPDAHNNLGVAFAGKGNVDAAIREFQEALRLRPDFADAHDNLEAALAQKGPHENAKK